MEIIAHNISEISVGQRKVDSYINATALATAHRKATGRKRDVSDWLNNKRVQEALKHLSSNTGIEAHELYQVFQGSPENGGGTWLHPKLSVRFAMWLSDDFGFQVENWIETWMTDRQNPIAVENQQADQLPMILPTDRQREFMRSREWERAEMEGRPLSREEIKEKSGYGEAQRLLDDRKQKRLN